MLSSFVDSALNHSFQFDDPCIVIETRIRAVPETNPMIAVRGLLVSNQ